MFTNIYHSTLTQKSEHTRLSSKAGIPSGLLPPLPLGIFFRLTSLARYLLFFSFSTNRWMFSFRFAPYSW